MATLEKAIGQVEDNLKRTTVSRSLSWINMLQNA
jgi:hypothetical protein